MKFGRTYSMVVEAQGGIPFVELTNAIKIDFPLTLQIDVQRSTLACANSGKFLIYNLKEETRRRVLKDINDTLTRRSIVLYAGYVSEPKLPLIFQGDIWYAFSYRQKQDWVTEISAFDGGFGIQNGQADLSVPSGYDLTNVLRNIIGTMPGVTVGAIGDVGSKQNGRGISISGNAWQQIQALVPNAETFIDNGKANIMNENEFISSIGNGKPFLLNSQSGLLETPRKYKERIDVKILFEPRIHVGMLVEIQSVETFFNGIFCVKGVTHSGTISGAVGGQMITTLNVWNGTQGLKGVNG